MKLDHGIKLFIFKMTWFFAPLFLMGLIIFGLAIYSGESWPINKVIDYELLHPRSTIFSKKFMPDSHYRLKYNEILRRDPDILMLGSSRVLSFREEIFGEDADFFNAGRVLHSLDDLSDFTEILLPKINPKIIYLGVDFYWLGSKEYFEHALRKVSYTKDEIYDWRSYLYFNKMFLLEIIKKPSLIIRIINNEPDIFGKKTAIGLQALNGNGFRFDGSFQYGTVITERRGSPDYVDILTPPILEQIVSGIGAFQFDEYINPARVKTLKDFLIKVKEKNIHVIGFSAPFSIEVYQKLITSPHHKDFFAKSRQEISVVFEEAGFSYFDFHSPESLDIDDSYMLDGTHMGETAAAIVLKKITPDINIKTYLSQKITQKNTTPLEIMW